MEKARWPWIFLGLGLGEFQAQRSAGKDWAGCHWGNPAWWIESDGKALQLPSRAAVQRLNRPADLAHSALRILKVFMSSSLPWSNHSIFLNPAYTEHSYHPPVPVYISILDPNLQWHGGRSLRPVMYQWFLQWFTGLLKFKWWNTNIQAFKTTEVLHFNEEKVVRSPNTEYI